MKRNRGLITPIKPDLALTPSTNHIYPALIEPVAVNLTASRCCVWQS